MFTYGWHIPNVWLLTFSAAEPLHATSPTFLIESHYTAIVRTFFGLSKQESIVHGIAAGYLSLQITRSPDRETTRAIVQIEVKCDLRRDVFSDNISGDGV